MAILVLIFLIGYLPEVVFNKISVELLTVLSCKLSAIVRINKGALTDDILSQKLRRKKVTVMYGERQSPRMPRSHQRYHSRVERSMSKQKNKLQF